MENFLISIVVPFLNEELVLRETVKRIQSVVHNEGWEYEIIFVNDGSRDSSLAILREEKNKDGNIKIINLSRNFGHQIALTAGLDQARGNPVIVIDADLQDPPELIPAMVKKWKEGYEIVHARRRRRFGETIFKKWTAFIIYRLIKKISNVDIPVDVGDFRLIGRKALDSLNKIRERHRYVRGLVAWLGYKQAFVEYHRDKRYAGKTKYPMIRMLQLVIEGITSFSILPLRIATIVGIFSSALSFLYIIYALYIRLILKIAVQGWTTVVIAVFFLGGIQLICLGVIGEYIGIIHEEEKKRPLYLIDEII